MFSRFEREAGGKLMVGTLCLLEVSRHGLLETELLALLGEESNIDVPAYEEGEDELIVAKTEETMQQEKDVELDKDGVEELTDKFAKLVDEAYVVKDEDKDEKKISKLNTVKNLYIRTLRQKFSVMHHLSKNLLHPEY